MRAIPTGLQSNFDEQLQIRAVPIALHELYKKWLLYYLDFCQKYKFPPMQEKSLLPFPITPIPPDALFTLKPSTLSSQIIARAPLI